MGRTAGYRHRPRRGSMQFWHRRRAKRIYPRIRSWANSKEIKLLGFAAYKAGMTHVIAVDNNPKSSTKGEEIRIPVTILDAPPIKILGLRVYDKRGYGSDVIGEAWTDQFSVELKRRLRLPKKRLEADKLKALEPKLESASEVKVLVHTNPKQAAFGKKKPEILEIALGGSNPKEQFEFAKSILGKEISASEALKEGEFLDIIAVSKGKGFQGVIKRFGVRLEGRKAETRRKAGTLGSWDVRTWRAPHAGQMGFHARTAFNKQVIKISNVKDAEVNPVSGLVKYGKVKGDYILIAGSVVGPKKRLIRLRHAIRQRKGAFTQAPEIQEISLRSQQG